MPAQVDPLAPPGAAAIAAFARRLGRIWFLILAAAVAVALYAAIERRGLHADGAGFLMRLLEREIFDLAEPARRSVMVLLQAPAVLAIRLDLVDAAEAGLVFCLTLELLPLLLLGLCYAVLPAERKHFFYFPLLHYLAASLSASASPIVEGIAASVYFWLLFYLVLFHSLRGARLAVAALVALPALYLHEAMGGLGVALAAAALWRRTREPAAWRRAAFIAFAAWFVAVGALGLHYIFIPRSVANRGDLVGGFLEMGWLLGRAGEINVPAWLGLLALAAVNVASFSPQRRGREGTAATWLTAAFALCAAAGVAVPALVPATIAPEQHFLARVNPALLSLALAAGVLGSLLVPARQLRWARPATVSIAALLAAGCLAWHALEIHAWSRYIGIIRTVLAEPRGFVTPAAVAAGLDGCDRKIFANMSWSWAFPELSLVLAPRGKVMTIIGRARAVPWWTWDPREPAQVPKSRFFDASAYRGAPASPAR